LAAFYNYNFEIGKKKGDKGKAMGRRPKAKGGRRR
jgi:hypothetical protein